MTAFVGSETCQGWELLEENQLQDVGISAFSGANASGGALSRFLKAIRERKVPTGSFLIVESFDRLTRQEALKSFGLFNEIINAGSIMAMSRAHEESRLKSERLVAAWQHKRKNADNRKLTARCPSWLRLSADKKKFEVIKDRANVVVRMFKESAAGIGSG